MTIRALIFDLDGTAMPATLDGMPSSRVIAAVKKAKAKIFVSVATGRPYPFCKQIIEALNIDRPSILTGGAQIFDPTSKEYIWEQRLDTHMIQQVLSVSSVYPYKITSDKDKNASITLGYAIKKNISMLCIFAVPKEAAMQIKQQIDAVSGVIAHLVTSWTPGVFDIHITHELGTKKHAMQALLAKENIHPNTVMAVGDSLNDLPLFELAGFKVAMGNASAELKAQADWIAPNIDEDGLAVAIERYILP